MILKNYLFVYLALISEIIGRGVTFRKRLYKTSRILHKNYPKGCVFCFLQVGANDGKSFDDLYTFVVERDCSGLLIEPIKDYYVELCLNYKSQEKLIKVQKAVHRKENIVTLYKIDDAKRNLYPRWVRGMASLNKNKLTELDFVDNKHILEEEVEAKPLMDIIKANNFEYFDYIQIDTEGYDYEVIEMFDFKEYKPKMIKAEFINLTKEEQILMTEKLKKNGYFVFFDGMDIIGVNLKLIRL